MQLASYCQASASSSSLDSRLYTVTNAASPAIACGVSDIMHKDSETRRLEPVGMPLLSLHGSCSFITDAQRERCE